jgi:hypothetical protein
VRAEADELQGFVIGLAVDQNKIWPHVAVAEVSPIASERMVAIPRRQGPIANQRR